jgi:hypothetical protein
MQSFRNFGWLKLLTNTRTVQYYGNITSLLQRDANRSPRIKASYL